MNDFPHKTVQGYQSNPEFRLIAIVEPDTVRQTHDEKSKSGVVRHIDNQGASETMYLVEIQDDLFYVPQHNIKALLVIKKVHLTDTLCFLCQKDHSDDVMKIQKDYPHPATRENVVEAIVEIQGILQEKHGGTWAVVHESTITE